MLPWVPSAVMSVSQVEMSEPGSMNNENWRAGSIISGWLTWMSLRKFKSICMNMMMSSNGNIFHVTGHLCREFTGDRWIPCTKDSFWQSFGVFFDLRLIEGLSKQSGGRWFEMPSRPLWRHCNESHVHCTGEANMFWSISLNAWHSLNAWRIINFQLWDT